MFISRKQKQTIPNILPHSPKTHNKPTTTKHNLKKMLGMVQMSLIFVKGFDI